MTLSIVSMRGQPPAPFVKPIRWTGLPPPTLGNYCAAFRSQHWSAGDFDRLVRHTGGRFEPTGVEEGEIGANPLVVGLALASVFRERPDATPPLLKQKVARALEVPAWSRGVPLVCMPRVVEGLVAVGLLERARSALRAAPVQGEGEGNEDEGEDDDMFISKARYDELWRLIQRAADSAAGKRTRLLKEPAHARAL